MLEVLVPLQYLQENKINFLWQQDTNLPKYQPRQYKFTRWETIIQLLVNVNATLAGPFNFKSITQFNCVCKMVDLHQKKTFT